MLEQLKKKMMRKCTFFFKLGSAQRCNRLGSEKWHFSGKRVGFLKTNAMIRCKIHTANHYWTVAEIFNSLKEDTIYI